MSTTQWIMIGLAALLVAPSVFNLSVFSSLFKKLFSKTDKVQMETSKEKPHNECDGLVDVVECWEHLIDCCESQGMNEAAKQLKGIFPLFVLKSEVNNEQ